jgi:CRISPR system Cascade subunit CasA
MPFLLTTEPWIPCVTRAGACVDLSLRDALVGAHELAELHDASPLVTLALHRLLLAVLHRVFGPESLDDWRALRERGSFDAVALDAYLERWSHRFDLCHPERPFYQTRGLSSLYEPDGLGKLQLERSNYGGPVHVFQHRASAAREVDALPLGVAARTLVALHAFTPGGLVKKKGEPTSASAGPLNRGAYALARGATFFETLLFNLLVLDDDRPVPRSRGADVPAWERDGLARPTTDKEPTRAPTGWIDLLTWQSRRVELAIDERGVVGVVYCVGQGLDLPGLTPEPMLAYRRTKKDVVPLLLSEDRAVWRDSQTLVQAVDADAGTRPPLVVEQLRRYEIEDVLGDRPLVLDVLGMRGDQAKILLSRHERLSLPVALVRDAERQRALREAMSLAEDVALRVVFAVRSAVEETLAPGGRTPDPADVRRVADSLGVERTYWGALGRVFPAFLDDLARDVAGAVPRFERAIRGAAEEAARRAVASLGTGARQLQGAARAEQRLGAAFAELMPNRGGVA